MILTLMLALGLSDWVKSSWFISNLKQPTLHCQIKCLIWACPDWCMYFTLIGKKHHVFVPFFLSFFRRRHHPSDRLSVCLSIAVPQTVHEWQVSPQRLWPVCVRWSGLVEQCVQRSSSTSVLLCFTWQRCHVLSDGINRWLTKEPLHCRQICHCLWRGGWHGVRLQELCAMLPCSTFGEYVSQMARLWDLRSKMT